MKRIYVSGPLTGLPDYNYPALLEECRQGQIISG
ncbi:DUF4406 domain-containing protein [Pseudomonas sp. W2-17]